MKRKSMKKSILACGISLALVIGSVPVMSFAEDTVTDGQNSALEESQDPEAETSSGEKYVYDSRYDFDSNKISISGENEKVHWEVSSGDVDLTDADTLVAVGDGASENMDSDAIEFDPKSLEDRDITVRENDGSDSTEIADDNKETELFSSGDPEEDLTQPRKDSFSSDSAEALEEPEETPKETTEASVEENSDLDSGNEQIEFSDDQEVSTVEVETGEAVTDQSEMSTENSETEVFSAEEESANEISSVEEEAFSAGEESTDGPQYQLENGVLTVSGTGKINNDLYKNNGEIRELVIEDGITAIGSYSFYGCTGLTRVVLPDTLTTMGNHAFAKCTALTEIALNEGLSDIGGRAFEDCTALEKVFIPLSVEAGSVEYTYNPNSHCAWGIFNNCTSLTTVEFAEGTFRIHAGLFGGSGIQKIVFPETVKEIGNFAFANCAALEEMIFPDSLEKIGEHAFSSCKKVRKIDFTEKISEIGSRAFTNDSALEEVSVPLNLQKADVYYQYNSGEHNAWGIFDGCSNLRTVNFAEGTTMVHGGMFAGSGLTEIKIPDTVTKVNSYAFANCRSLTDFTTGSNLRSIDENALANCSSLKNLDFLSLLTSVGEGALYGCGISELELPETLTTIGAEAFGNCKSLKKVVLPVTVMDGSSYSYNYNMTGSCTAQGIFSGCNNLEEVIFPEKSDRIPGGLLAGSGIKSITIPDTITSIGPYAFSGTGITEITIQDTVTDIGFCAFSACSKLKEITMPLGWQTCSEFLSESGPYYQGNLVRGCSALEKVILPEGLKKIPDYAFSNCNNITWMDFPDSLTEIGMYAFFNCSSLSSVHLSKGISKISDNAFGNCEKLLTINVPDTVTSIGEKVVNNCPSLVQINYAGSSKDWSKIQISSSNDTFDKIVINYDFKVTYTESDFIGIWDGEYDGNDGSTRVRRHFVFTINECKKVSENTARISGIRVISQSLENPSDYYAEGSDNVVGTVNLKTGTLSFQGNSWIQYPSGPNATGNWDHMEYDGCIDPDKKSMKGRTSNDSTRTFHAENISVPSGTNTSVILKYNNDQYDLYKDEISFVKGSSEKVSIIVSPDWNGATAGKVRIYQKDFAIENKTGIFLDIAPGNLFKENESIYMALVDANDKVIDTRKLTLTVETARQSRNNLTTANTSLTVFQNKNKSTDAGDSYIVSNGAEILTEGNTYKTDKSGNVKFPTVSSGEITISKKGYVSRTLTASQIAENSSINLQKVNDEGPVISGVWVGDTDVLNNVYSLNMVSTQKLTLDLEIDWGKSSCETVRLMQDQRTKEFQGDSLTTVISDDFDTSKDIFIVAKDTKGRITKRKLQFQNGTVDSAVNSLNGVSFSISDKISISLPDNFKPEFLAGESFGVGINGVSSLVPVTLSAEDGKVYVAVGVDLLSYSYSDNTAQSVATGNKAHVLKSETSNFIKNFKDTGIMDGSGALKSIKKLKNLKQTYKNAIKYPQGKFGIDADFTILGFAEGTYDDKGNISWLDSGVILNPSGSISKTWPFVIMAGPVPIPMYWEASFSVDALAQFNLIFNKQAKNFLPDGELSGTMSLNGGLGAGIKNVLYASGGIEGKLKPDWKIVKGDTDSFVLTATANIYAKAGIACFEGKYSFDPIYNKVWIKYPKDKDLLTQSLDTDAVGNIAGEEVLLDTDQYKLKDLSYLDRESGFTANDKTNSEIALFSSGEDIDTTELFKSNIYKESTPVIAELPSGKKVAVWTDSASSDANQIMLYYSVWKNGTWSAPKLVYNDGTMDYAPCLKEINGKIYLAWQNATRKFENIESLGLSDIAGDFDISAGVFLEGEDRFSVSTIPYSNLDMMPVITGNEKGVYVVWINNGENDWLGANNSNSILYSPLNGSSYGTVTKAYEGLYAVAGMAADYDGSLNIAYSMDTDNNITTSEDLRVYENGTLVSGETSSYSPAYMEHQLYWHTRNNIVNKQTMDNDGSLSSDNFQILNANGEKVLLYTAVSGLTSTLMISYYNEETASWGKGTALTDGKNFIGAFDGEVDADGNISIMANCAEVTGTVEDENPYGESSMILLTVKSCHDLSLDNVYYAEDSFCAGESMPFTLEITNKGNTIEKGISVEMKDENGTVLASEEKEDILAPGETLKTTVCYTVAEGTEEQNIEILVKPGNAENADTGNNIQKIHLAYEKVFVENLNYGYNENGNVVVSADIVNRGYHTRDDLNVYLTEKTADGNVVASEMLDTVAPMDLQTVSFEIKAKQNQVYYVVLKEENKDESLSDDFLTIYTGGDSEEEHEHTYVTTVTKATLKKNGSVVKKCSECGYIASRKVIYRPETITLSKNSYSYNGKTQKPSVKVKGENGKTITSANYKVTYSSGCKNAGRYTAKITFRGNYTGTVSRTFTIVPKGTSISGLRARSGGFEVKWKKQSAQTTGYQIQYATNSSFKKGKTVTVISAKTVSRKISGLGKKKKYYVRIRTYKAAGKTRYYSGWSKVKSVKTK